MMFFSRGLPQQSVTIKLSPATTQSCFGFVVLYQIERGWGIWELLQLSCLVSFHVVQGPQLQENIKNAWVVTGGKTSCILKRPHNLVGLVRNTSYSSYIQPWSAPTPLYFAEPLWKNWRCLWTAWSQNKLAWYIPIIMCECAQNSRALQLPDSLILSLKDPSE